MTSKLPYSCSGDPIVNPKGTLVISIKFRDGKRSMTTYRRHMVQVAINRMLERGETYLFKDNDETNFSPDNIIVYKHRNPSEEAKRYLPALFIECECAYCGKLHIKSKRSVERHRTNPEYQGPFCSNSCATKHNYNRIRYSTSIKAWERNMDDLVSIGGPYYDKRTNKDYYVLRFSQQIRSKVFVNVFNKRIVPLIAERDIPYTRCEV